MMGEEWMWTFDDDLKTAKPAGFIKFGGDGKCELIEAKDGKPEKAFDPPMADRIGDGHYCFWAVNMEHGPDKAKLYIDWHLKKPVFFLLQEMGPDGKPMMNAAGEPNWVKHQARIAKRGETEKPTEPTKPIDKPCEVTGDCKPTKPEEPKGTPLVLYDKMMGEEWMWTFDDDL